jgi:hypothetical protein
LHAGSGESLPTVAEEAEDGDMGEAAVMIGCAGATDEGRRTWHQR